jgi:hypothetical protein
LTHYQTLSYPGEDMSQGLKPLFPGGRRCPD